MQDMIIDFNQLNSEEIAVEAAHMIYEGIYAKNVFQKSYSKNAMTQIYAHLSEKGAKGQSKFYTLFLLRQIILKKDKKIIGLLNSSSFLLDMLQKIALDTDPKKLMSEKGKNLFSEDKNGIIGKKYLRILLETIVFLGQTFTTLPNGEPTKFKKVLSKLEQQNVVLPTETQYFPQKQKKSTLKQPKPAQSQIQKPSQPKENTKNNGKFESLVGFVKFKIEEYIDNIDQCEEIESLEVTITKFHHLSIGEMKKFDEFGDLIYEAPPQIIEQYLKIRGFLQIQNQCFQQHMSKNQHKSYCDAIKIKYEQIFPQQQNSTPQPPKNNEKPKMQPAKPIIQKKLQTQPHQPLRKINSVTTSKQNYERDEGNVVRINKNQNRTVEGIKGLFSRLESRSNSVSVRKGFRVVQQSLEKQKQMIRAHPPRAKNQVSRIVASTLSKTGMKVSSIFRNPPNSVPPHKNYEGDIVFASKQIDNILFDIKKEQGHRRFKIANFRNRYPLYENETIQIGFKSQPIYQRNEDDFNEILSFELFIGNKTSRQLKNFEIVFEGDQNCLVYTNPRDFPSFIEGQQQLKHQLMIVPFKIPYGFLTMKIFYQHSSSSTHATIALPNSIIKMTSFLQISRVQNDEYWQISTAILKSDYFKLSHHMPPNTIRKYMPQLNELSNYSQFSLPGSTIDYGLFCLLEIMKDYQGVLKISIRPDLNVVIQIGMIEPSEDATKHAKFFIQTLQMILQENGN